MLWPATNLDAGWRAIDSELRVRQPLEARRDSRRRCWLACGGGRKFRLRPAHALAIRRESAAASVRPVPCRNLHAVELPACLVHGESRSPPSRVDEVSLQAYGFSGGVFVRIASRQLARQRQCYGEPTIEPSLWP